MNRAIVFLFYLVFTVSSIVVSAQTNVSSLNKGRESKANSSNGDSALSTHKRATVKEIEMPSLLLHESKAPTHAYSKSVLNTADSLVVRKQHARNYVHADSTLRVVRSAGLKDSTSLKEEYYSYSPLDSSALGFLNQIKSIDVQIQRFRDIEYDFWLFWIMLLPLIAIAYLRHNFFKDIQESVVGVSNIKIAQQLYRTSENTTSFFAITLNINFVFTAGLLLYVMSKNYLWQLPLNGGQLLLFYCVGVGSLYLLKYVTLSLMAMLFPFKEVLRFYFFNLALITRILGIILIPFIVFIAFSPPMIREISSITALVLVLLFLLQGFLRGIVIAKDYLMFHKFHFFIYLCTLEIAPVFILIKCIRLWAGF